MFLHFIGVNEKIVNLNSIVMIEDESVEGETRAKLTTIYGDEFTLTGTDADAVFARAEILTQAADFQVSQLTGPQLGVTQ